VDAAESQAAGLVRCPDPACAHVFPVAPVSLGRTVHCARCGRLLTARPVELDERLRAQEKRLARSGETIVPAATRLAVLVDDVRSLWNVGSIFRTADGCGFGLVVLCGITGCPPRREISKTALGAELAIAWRYRAGAGEAVGEVISEGFVPIAVEATPQAIPLDAIEWPERACLVVGNEVAGISPGALAACAAHVAIPMRGVKDSLNVAVAFGIAAHRAAAAMLPPPGAAGPRPS
jgi:tRNA G18 (ribose-2'-O)-methylase SpoU